MEASLGGFGKLAHWRLEKLEGKKYRFRLTAGFNGKIDSKTIAVNVQLSTGLIKLVKGSKRDRAAELDEFKKLDISKWKAQFANVAEAGVEMMPRSEVPPQQEPPPPPPPETSAPTRAPGRPKGSLTKRVKQRLAAQIRKDMDLIPDIDVKDCASWSDAKLQDVLAMVEKSRDEWLARKIKALSRRRKKSRATIMAKQEFKRFRDNTKKERVRRTRDEEYLKESLEYLSELRAELDDGKYPVHLEETLEDVNETALTFNQEKALRGRLTALTVLYNLELKGVRDAYELTAAICGPAVSTVEVYEHQFRSTGALLITHQGAYERELLACEEDLKARCVEFVREHTTKHRGGTKMTAEVFRKFCEDEIIPEMARRSGGLRGLRLKAVQQPDGTQKYTMSTRTAQTWLGSLGFYYSQLYKKHTFYDGHDAPDTLLYRAQYLEKYYDALDHADAWYSLNREEALSVGFTPDFVTNQLATEPAGDGKMWVSVFAFADSLQVSENREIA